MVDAERIRDAWRSIRERLDQAARKAGRDPSTVRLVAVTKGFPAGAVAALAPLGAVRVGENRVQEAMAKQDAVPVWPGLEWHLIGHLQTNKAARAAERFALIHSLDRPALLDSLVAAAHRLGRAVPVLIQVNVSGEATKSGCRPEELPDLLVSARQSGVVAVRGLMTMPPWSPDPEAARPHFARLLRLRQEMADRFGGGDELSELSMGMSDDFEVAVAEGATLVRVGTAIFGSRVG